MFLFLQFNVKYYYSLLKHDQGHQPSIPKLHTLSHQQEAGCSYRLLPSVSLMRLKIFLENIFHIFSLYIVLFCSTMLVKILITLNYVH